MRRGQERFDIYCAPCHGLAGVRRRHRSPSAPTRCRRAPGRRPPRCHTDLVRGRPVGHLFNTITNGIRNMPAYGAADPGRRTAGRSSPTCGPCSAARTRASTTCRPSCGGSSGRGGRRWSRRSPDIVRGEAAPGRARASGCGAAPAAALAGASRSASASRSPRGAGGWRRFFFAYLVELRLRAEPRPRRAVLRPPPAPDARGLERGRAADRRGARRRRCRCWRCSSVPRPARAARSSTPGRNRGRRGADHVLRGKAAYLNVPFFVVALGGLLRRLERARRASSCGARSRRTRPATPR